MSMVIEMANRSIPDEAFPMCPTCKKKRLAPKVGICGLVLCQCPECKNIEALDGESLLRLRVTKKKDERLD